MSTSVELLKSMALGGSGGGGITPSGSVEIAENGTYDVTTKAQAVVDVPSTGGLTWFDIISGNYTKAVVINGQWASGEDLVIPQYLYQNKGVTSVECIVKGYSGSTVNQVNVNQYAFSSNTELTDAVVPSFKKLNERCFADCPLTGTLDFSGVTIIGKDAFFGASAAELKFPALTTINQSGLGAMSALTRVEIGNYIKYIGDQAFWNDTALETVVIRCTKDIPTLGSRAFNGTLIASGAGYIYVPDALVSQYQAATNWATWEAQIKGLSELPE